MRLSQRILGFDRRVAQAFPPVGTVVRIAGRRLHYLGAGTATGLPVVLLHGASGNLLDWHVSIMPELARRHRVIAFDRPGFGHSAPAPGEAWTLSAQIEHMRQALMALGHRRYVLVGHSYAGALVLAWALAHPQEVAGVLTQSGAMMDWGGGLGLTYTLGGAPVIGDVMAGIARVLASPAYVAKSLAEIFAPQPVPPGYIARAGIEFAVRPQTFRLNALMMDRLHRQIVMQQPRYGDISCPVEIVHGLADIIVPADLHAEALAEVLPDARLTLMPGIGHMPHHAEPRTIIDRIDRLMARAGAQTGDCSPARDPQSSDQRGLTGV